MNKRGLPTSESQLVLESQGHDSDEGLSHTQKNARNNWERARSAHKKAEMLLKDQVEFLWQRDVVENPL